MPILIQQGVNVTASFTTPQEIVIDHADDSIKIGDGTDTVETTDVGGVQCLNVRPYGAGDASSANQTNGTQRTKITDGVDNVGISTVGADKALKVDIVQTVGGGSAPGDTDDGAFGIGTDLVSPIGALADETAADSVDEGDLGILRMTLDRLLKIQVAGVASGIAIPVTDNASTLSIDDGGGNISIDDGGNSITVDGTVAITNANLDAALSTLATAAKQDTQTTALQLIDDPVATIGAAHVAKAFQIAGSDGTNNLRIKTDASGELQVDVLTLPSVTIGSAIPAGTNNIGDVDVLTLPGVAGTVAHDSADSGNPVKIGGKARTTNPTAVADADRVDATYDDLGRQVMIPYHVRDLVTRGTITLSGTTETTLIASAGAGVFVDLVQILVTNTSSTAVRVDIRDATGGTVIFSLGIAANGGAVVPFPATLPQATANNNWTAQLSASVTDIRITAIGVKNV